MITKENQNKVFIIRMIKITFVAFLVLSWFALAWQHYVINCLDNGMNDLINENIQLKRELRQYEN